VALEPEQEELLGRLIEAARLAPRAEQQWHLFRAFGDTELQGPGDIGAVLEDDVRVLAEAGYLRVTNRWTAGFEFRIAPAGHEYYAEMRQRIAEPMARQESEVRRLLETEAFGTLYPNAYTRWAEAEALLWSAESEREFTTIGHKTREAMQEFATEIVRTYNPPDVDSNPALVNRRLGAVIAMFLPTLGEARAELLKALGDYSEANWSVIQRQEHGGQKEGHALTWQDARRVVFHTAFVMYEFAVSLEEARPAPPPPAVLEGG
jgi:hypothetical protein